MEERGERKKNPPSSKRQATASVQAGQVKVGTPSWQEEL